MLKRFACPLVRFVVERSADRPWVLAPRKERLRPHALAQKRLEGEPLPFEAVQREVADEDGAEAYAEGVSDAFTADSMSRRLAKAFAQVRVSGGRKSMTDSIDGHAPHPHTGGRRNALRAPTAWRTERPGRGRPPVVVTADSGSRRSRLITGFLMLCEESAVKASNARGLTAQRDDSTGRDG